MAEQSTFHVRLAPMVEGSIRTSEGGSSSGNDNGGKAAQHDPTEL